MSRGYEPLDCGFDRTSQDISLRNIPSASGYDSVSQLTEYEDGFENDSTSSLSPNASAVDPLTTVSALPKHIPHSSAPSLVAQEAPRRSQSTGPHPSDSAEQQQFQEIDPSPKQRSTLVSKYYQNWWFWELAGAILSAVCILAVVVLAYNINKTLLSAWKLPSSPSTMISTFITIAKTAMLLPVSEGLSQLKWLYFWINRSKHRPLGDIEAFEDASRGPWGSLLIFGRIGFQQGSPLALFGAFITIATLAMGPFAQQVISFKQENVPQPGINSTIPIARVYDTGIIPTRLSLNNPNVVDTAMQGAIFNGLFDLGAPFDFFCPSGNCTWPDFSSLAMCNTCKNVSNGTIKAEHGKNFTFKTPGGIQVRMSQYDSDWASYDLVGGAYRWKRSIAIAQAEGEGVGFMFEPSVFYFSDPNFKKVFYRITECNITWCARLYKNVKVIEQINGSLTNFSTEDTPLDQMGRADDNWNLRLSPFGSNDTHQPAMPPWGNEPFVINGGDNSNINQLISEIFDFNFGSWNKKRKYEFNAGRPLYKRNVSEIMSNITDSMTNTIRHGRNATVANGVVLQTDTIILVQWNWLILPIALVVLDFVFLAFVICVTSSQGAPLWKSGLIPLFFHGLEEGCGGRDEQQQRSRGDRRLETRSEMEEEAVRMSVRLQRGQDDRTRFVVVTRKKSYAQEG